MWSVWIKQAPLRCADRSHASLPGHVTEEKKITELDFYPGGVDAFACATWSNSRKWSESHCGPFREQIVALLLARGCVRSRC
jgi:hypothetical protein